MVGYFWNSPKYTTATVQNSEIEGLTPGGAYKIYLYSAGPYNQKGNLFTLNSANVAPGSGSYLLLDANVNGAGSRDPAWTTSSGSYAGFVNGVTPTTSAPTAYPTASNDLGSWGIFSAVADANGNIKFSYGVPSFDGAPTSRWYFFNAMQIQPVVASTPEPATWGLLAASLGGMLLLRRSIMNSARNRT
jgi:hypothetical protein